MSGRAGICLPEHATAHPLASFIRDRITAFLTDQISLSEFHDWLVGATWDVEQHADPGATDLAYSSTLALAELSRGDISQAVSRDRRREIVGAPIPSR